MNQQLYDRLQLSPEFRDTHPAVPWRNMAGRRNKLIHDYDGVNVKRVWQVVCTSIPDLLNQLKPLLPKEGDRE